MDKNCKLRKKEDKAMGSTGGSRASSGSGERTTVQYTDRSGNPIGRPVTYRQTSSGVRQGRRSTGVGNLSEIRRNARRSGNRTRRG